VFLLLIFQILILGFGAGLMSGRPAMVFGFLSVFLVVCGLVVAIGKSL
jgi:hypothetical protein